MESASQQLRILLDGTEQVLPPDDFERKVTEAARGERAPLRAKLGVDPTAPDIHLGHTVVLRKLRDFQRLGHVAVLIIGGFTAQVGDPSGRSATRPRLSADEVSANAATYLTQARKVLAPGALEVVDNREWLAGMTMTAVLELAASMTVARMLQRDDFAQRYRSGKAIAISEFLYPLLQGRDSVAVAADVEIGGTDQTFNLLVGRDLQERAGQEPQSVMTLPLLEGTDGVAKMSKSTGNYIGVDESPAEMFGKTMRIPDPLMARYFRLLTDLHPDEVDDIAAGILHGRLDPGQTKRRLGREIVSLYHSPESAVVAEDDFNRRFRDRSVPQDAPVFELGGNDRWFLPALLQAAELVASGSEARRMVRQGGVRLDGTVLTDPTVELKTSDLDGQVLAVGKRRAARLRAGAQGKSAPQVDGP